MVKGHKSPAKVETTKVTRRKETKKEWKMARDEFEYCWLHIFCSAWILRINEEIWMRNMKILKSFNFFYFCLIRHGQEMTQKIYHAFQFSCSSHSICPYTQFFVKQYIPIIGIQNFQPSDPCVTCQSSTSHFLL